ncbi:MAG: hypothetical protein Hyperionvirus17_7 [Hyperionvirus sp.]|uniref:Uncharacterized protein n=1 Tax=Hyperionvirus sp. TaxID=2487770 RepID=A0A3G5AA03_9VIRU|nr:MAG: hypothetical protein Hyperionvirus17_7 [Hyperionvirus sp.]
MTLNKKYLVEACKLCTLNKFVDIGHTVTYHHQDKEIIDAVAKLIPEYKKINEQLLIAQAQCGKSDIIKRIFECFNNNKKYFSTEYQIESVYLIICASANDLKEDHQMEFHNFIESKNKVLHLNDLLRLIKKFKNRDPISPNDDDIKIYHEMKNNSLLIFDESHADLEEQATIDMFRKMLSIEFDNYTNSTVKVLNVSATAYDQLMAGIKTIFLLPRKGYWGITEMFKNKKVFPAYDLLNYKDLEAWLNHICNQLNKKDVPNGLYIIRVDTKIDGKKVEQNLYKYFAPPEQCIVDFYDMEREYNLDVKHLKNKVAVPTFIIIMNKLRKGNRIIKNNIIAVHDKLNNMLTHTTYQGLLGRMTGYNANKNALIYCDKLKATEHLQWIQHNYALEKIPTHTQWIKSDGTIKPQCMLSTSLRSI